MTDVLPDISASRTVKDVLAIPEVACQIYAMLFPVNVCVKKTSKAYNVIAAAWLV